MRKRIANFIKSILMKKYNIRNMRKSVRLTEINPTLFCWADDARYSGSIGDAQTFIGDFPCLIGDS